MPLQSLSTLSQTSTPGLPGTASHCGAPFTQRVDPLRRHAPTPRAQAAEAQAPPQGI
jgi:hypothetical protein